MGRAAVRIHTMKSSLMKPLFAGSESSSYTGLRQLTGFAVPEREKTCFREEEEEEEVKSKVWKVV